MIIQSRLEDILNIELQYPSLLTIIGCMHFQIKD